MIYMPEHPQNRAPVPTTDRSDVPSNAKIALCLLVIMALGPVTFVGELLRVIGRVLSLIGRLCSFVGRKLSDDLNDKALGAFKLWASDDKVPTNLPLASSGSRTKITAPIPD
jgi:hypothetical protein